MISSFLGPSYYIPPGESLDIDNNDTTQVSSADTREDRGLEIPKDITESAADSNANKQADEILPKSKRHYVIYGVEIGLSIFAGILMITTNALLSKRSFVI